MTEPLHIAELDWNENGLPVSRRYGDVYFSNEGGLDEARHVFLAGNALPQRLPKADVFTVGETGFGSGLNFLALWQLWEKAAPPHARLRFFSAEKHPLRQDDMARIHALFPDIVSYGKQLCAQLPLPVPGYHRLYFAGGRVQLTLMYGDALAMMQQQDAKANAWFLDGFAPRLNPDLWSAELAMELRRLSADGATVATFSTSGTTQTALAHAGFSLQKQPGFGRKKYMLAGNLAGTAYEHAPPSQTTVIGGGLAGASTAYALALRGCEVELCEQEKTVAAGASGNPSAIFYPGITVGWQAQSLLYYMGFSHTLGVLRALHAQQPIAHDLCGMLLFPRADKDPGRQAKALATMQPDRSIFYGVNAEEASILAGVQLRQNGLFFPQSGWVNLGQLTQALLTHSRIHVRYQASAAIVHPNGATPTILCNGWQAGQIYPPLQSSLHPVGGQVTCLPTIEQLKSLRCVLSYGGYVTPTIDGVHHMGASYDKQMIQAQCSAEGNQENCNKLAQFLDADISHLAATRSWSALRSVSRNRLPLVGKLKNGLYANLAHASRGLLSCALSGEYVASHIYGDPLPLPRDIATMLSPIRFMG